MSKVFISYSSNDREWVEGLTKKLHKDGIDVWYDEWEICVGDSIIAKIEEGIGRSDFLVVVLSEASVASRWVQEELRIAVIKTIEKGSFILPVLLESCEIPEFLRHRRYANFKDDPEKAYQELLTAIKHRQRPIPNRDKEILDIATLLLSLYINGYELASDQEKARMELEVQEEYRSLQQKWRMPPSVFAFYIRVCIEEKRIIHVSEFLDRMVEFVGRHREVATDIAGWLIENMMRSE